MVETGAGENQGLSSASESTDVVFKESVRALVTNWYAANARPLPWRAPGVSAWGVLVSEVMSQQTPVSRALAVLDETLAHPGRSGPFRD